MEVTFLLSKTVTDSSNSTLSPLQHMVLVAAITLAVSICALSGAGGSAATAASSEEAIVAASKPHTGSPGLPTTRIKPINGVLRIVVDGKPLTGFAFLGLGDPKHTDEAYDAGIRLFTFGASMGNETEGTFNGEGIDKFFADFFTRMPEAYVFPRIGVTPRQWWLDANPDELCLFDSGKKGPQSFASLKWRKELGEQLRAYVNHIKSAPYADRIIGVQICSGYTAEWQAWGLHDNERSDFSKPNLAGYRKWLAENIRARSAKSPGLRSSIPIPPSLSTISITPSRCPTR